MRTLVRTRARLVSLRPSVSAFVDALFVLGLGMLGMLGFSTSFAGWQYLAVGGTGLLLGVLVAHIASVLRQSGLVVLLLALATFFLLGGALVLSHPVPTPTVLSNLAMETVGGWKDLLTTLPPVAETGPLLVLPYALGLMVGAGGLYLATHFAHPATALICPLAMLAVVILLGTQTPAARLVQGIGFTAAALLWLAVRAARNRPIGRTVRERLGRLGTAAVLVAVAVAGGFLLGPYLPGMGTHQRVVLRSYIAQPFDVGAYPSPLAGFRKYTKSSPFGLYGRQLFTVTGLPAGTRVRIATLDNYDGAVWGAAPSQPGGVDSFQRVGVRIPSPSRGRTVTAEFRIVGYGDVWLPDVGAVTRIRFLGGGSDLSGAFRYNLDTGTGIVPGGLFAGDRYTLQAVVSPALQVTSQDAPGASVLPLSADQTAFAQGAVTKWTQPGSGPVARLLDAAKHLRQFGAYTDGGTGAEASFLAGHSVGRLSAFLNLGQPAGDDEQYAAAFAAIANQLGIPARVVLGAVTEADGSVRGRDIHAWVEVYLAGPGWAPIYEDTFMPNKDKAPNLQHRSQPTSSSGANVPPPSVQRPPESGMDANVAQYQTGPQSKRKTRAVAPPAKSGGWLSTTVLVSAAALLAAALAIGGIIGFKAHRRRRRRNSGSASTRVAQGWREVLDCARDFGLGVPFVATRREQAAVLRAHHVEGLAQAADTAIFGPATPTVEDAQRFWGDVEQTRRRIAASASRTRRLRALLNAASLRAPAAGTR